MRGGQRSVRNALSVRALERSGEPIRVVSVLQGADGKRVTYAALTSSHPRWRSRPGRAARAAAGRAMIAQEPILGKRDGT